MIILDLETMGVESTSVVLSFAATHVTDDTTDYQKMLDSSIMIKLNIKEQFDKGRSFDKDTCMWWDRQVDAVKKASLIPSRSDFSVVDGINAFRVWLADRLTPEEMVMTRGPLDVMAIDSLCRTFDIPTVIAYNRYYDVRTAIDFSYDSAKNGYVDVDHPTFDVSMVLKHHPVHDCAYDGMMLVYGKK